MAFIVDGAYVYHAADEWAALAAVFFCVIRLVCSCYPFGKKHIPIVRFCCRFSNRRDHTARDRFSPQRYSE